MNTAEALAKLGVSESALTSAQRRALDDDGFFIVPDAFSAQECAEMAEEFDRLHKVEGERGGHEVHIEPGAPRVSNIFNKSAVFDRCLEWAPLLEASRYLLGEFKVHGANLRNPLRGQGHQPLHSDVPRDGPDDWRLVNAIIFFDDVTEGNGPPRVVPGSHHWQALNVPDVNLGGYDVAKQVDAQSERYPKDPFAPYPGEVHLTGPVGTVAVCNAHIWHSGTRNESGALRRVLHLTYTRRDLPQQLVQREYLTRGLYDRMNAAHRFLMDIEGEPKTTEQSDGPRERPVRTWRGVTPGS